MCGTDAASCSFNSGCQQQYGSCLYGTQMVNASVNGGYCGYYDGVDFVCPPSTPVCVRQVCVATNPNTLTSLNPIISYTPSSSAYCGLINFTSAVCGTGQFCSPLGVCSTTPIYSCQPQSGLCLTPPVNVSVPMPPIPAINSTSQCGTLNGQVYACANNLCCSSVSHTCGNSTDACISSCDPLYGYCPPPSPPPPYSGNFTTVFVSISYPGGVYVSTYVEPCPCLTSSTCGGGKNFTNLNCTFHNLSYQPFGYKYSHSKPPLSGDPSHSGSLLIVVAAAASGCMGLGGT